MRSLLFVAVLALPCFAGQPGVAVVPGTVTAVPQPIITGTPAVNCCPPVQQQVTRYRWKQEEYTATRWVPEAYTETVQVQQQCVCVCVPQQAVVNTTACTCCNPGQVGTTTLPGTVCDPGVSSNDSRCSLRERLRNLRKQPRRENRCRGKRG